MNILNTSREVNTCREAYLSEDYISLFIQYDEDLAEKLKDVDYACTYSILPPIYVVSMRADKYNDFIRKFRNVLSIDVSFPYTLSAIQPVDAANITKFHGEGFLNLTGENTIATIIDTGIDYLNPQFQNDDGTTRIVSIWDQTIQNPPSTNANAPLFGTVYSREEINRAIHTSLEGGNPYDIVPSRDEVGHGTNMAGLVGAKGLNGVIGGAPKCEFLIIKLKEAKTSNLKLIGINNRKNLLIYEGIDIYFAIQFAAAYHLNLRTPMSVLLSTGTNWGGHEGLSSIEQDIDRFSSRRGIIFVTNTGNQGASLTHINGRFLKSNTLEVLEFIVGENEDNLVLMLWIQKPDKISIAIISPSGEIVEPIQSRPPYEEFEQVNLILENSIINISFISSEFATGNESVYITIQNPKDGLWQLRLKGDYIVNGVYNMWLPQRPIIQPTTRVINPSPYTTLQAPANARKAITTSFYDQNNNTIAVESGRGFTADNRIKPNLTTGGIRALTTGLNNENTVLSGGSVAGAVLCSATLLMLQWGIVLKNDINMYGPTIISYLTRGTSKRSGDIYPNPEWGYGMLNLQGSFENLRSSNLLRTSDNYNAEDSLPYKCYIKTSKELYRRIDDMH
ncbi:S8 family peptidase [Clostridium sp.]|uniref:S8 family peptidase n=1 Tax=Clostridium sp. TaxID=1506 RepID=UPI00321809CB